MQHQISSREGCVPVGGGRVWFRVVGDAGGIPLLVLHGGPGVPHDYLEPLAVLANERPVVFYDQLGCGKSDRPEDASLWRVERFVEELAQVRRALGLQRVHLFGHSWGTILAVELALCDPGGVASLILAAPFLSAPYWLRHTLPALVAQMPEETQAVLKRYAGVDPKGSSEYQAAFELYSRGRLCHDDHFPEPLLKAVAGTNGQIRQTLFGQDEFHMTGPLKDYDRSEQLIDIDAPILFTCGRYDDATPEYTAWLCSKARSATMVVLEQSAHMAHLEETDRYVQVVRDFLKRAERHDA